MSTQIANQQGVGLEIDGVRKQYGSFTALDDISLTVPPGALLTLLGPSGCGKSTLLRIIAGFVRATSGQVSLDNKNIENVPPYQRETAMVFQSYALFPHMRILDNVMFGLKMRKVPKLVAQKRAMESLEMVRLSHLADRFPGQLSGGQQQRAALARALVTDPKILLLDEPFGALDKNLREEMQIELRKLQQSVGVTTVCVTHDQQEAMAISDYVAVMQGGRLEQFGAPLEIYDSPRSHFVATFIGSSNVLCGRVKSRQDRLCNVELTAGATARLFAHHDVAAGQEVRVAVRPGAVHAHSAEVAPEYYMAENTAFALPGKVDFCLNLGNIVNYEVIVEQFGKIIVEQTRRQNDILLSEGQAIILTASREDCVMLER